MGTLRLLNEERTNCLDVFTDGFFAQKDKSWEHPKRTLPPSRLTLCLLCLCASDSLQAFWVTGFLSDQAWRHPGQREWMDSVTEMKMPLGGYWLGAWRDSSGPGRKRDGVSERQGAAVMRRVKQIVTCGSECRFWNSVSKEECWWVQTNSSSLVLSTLPGSRDSALTGVEDDREGGIIWESWLDGGESQHPRGGAERRGNWLGVPWQCGWGGRSVFMTPRRTDPLTSPTHGGWV